MAFVPVSNTAQVQLVFLWDGQYVENVYHVHFDGAVTEGALLVLAADLVDWWSGDPKLEAPADFSLQKIILTDLTTQAGLSLEYSTGLPVVGTSGGARLPNNVTLAVKWNTGLRGRSFRGRTYHMPMLADWVVNNTVTSGCLETLRTIYGDLLAAVESVSGRTMVVVSRVHDHVARAAGLSTLIIGFSIDPVVDSQRRRLPGRGR